jgi:allophanate hydrolase subunit 2
VTGGYAKVATVIGADLGKLAQARPGERIRFEKVTIGQALAARLE